MPGHDLFLWEAAHCAKSKVECKANERVGWSPPRPLLCAGKVGSETQPTHPASLAEKWCAD